MRLIVLLPAVLTLAGTVPNYLAAQARQPIIDMHLHADTVTRGPTGAPLTRPCNPSPCQGIPSRALSADDVLKLTLEAMDRNNIVLGFLSSWPLDNVYRWIEAAPGRFIASAAVEDPGEIDLRALRKDYEARRLRGMGELANQYAGIEATDPRLEPFFALAEEFDVPVLIHHHGTAGPSAQFRISMGHPEQLEDIVVRHPNLRLAIETSGFPFLEETIALMYRYPQVYGDLSLWKYPREAFHRYLRGLVDAGLGKRLMFGSDQMVWPDTVIDDEIEAINSATFLNEEQKRDIFYNNAARFLRLSEAQIAAHHRR
jgi:predicted TIM-barrel fold metal-dependent hydrolase